MLALLLWLQDPADLIARLGHDDPDVREAATAALIALGPKAADVVHPYLTSDDPEVSARARWIVNAIEPPPTTPTGDAGLVQLHVFRCVYGFFDVETKAFDDYFFDYDYEEIDLIY